MQLWNEGRLKRTVVGTMLGAAGVSVLAAFYAVAAWGQGPRESAMLGRSLPAVPTVTVSSLRIPTAAWKHFDRAKSAEEHGRPEEFERETAKALEIAPEFAEIHLLRAREMVRTRRFAEAIGEVEAARRADARVMWAGVILAGAYNGMRRFNDARLALDAERGTEAETWQAVYERARAEIGLRNAEAGLRWSAKALAVAPEQFADAHLVRANALLLAGRRGEAKAQMEVYLGSHAPQPHRGEVLAAERLLSAGVVGDR